MGNAELSRESRGASSALSGGGEGHSSTILKGAAISSLLMGSFLMLFKFWGYSKSGSQAVFSDAMESIVNVIAAGLALFVVYYSAKPVDEDHPYGHGKIEFFSAAFEGGLISFAGVLIVIEAIYALANRQIIHNPRMGLVVVGIAGVINLGLGLVIMRIGKKHNSIALIASGKHLISDFVTSIGVIGGLGLVFLTGFQWIDSATAILAGILLIWEGVKLVRRSVAGLLDEEDPESLAELERIFQKLSFEGIIQIHHLKVIRSGAFHHIDAHLVIPEFWNVTEAHRKTTNFERQVIENYLYGGEMNFHLDPCRRAYCRVCDLKDCPIRYEKFEKRMPVQLEHLRSRVEPNEFLKQRR
jgi:cation diffusion facilitator family transporter